MAHTGSLLNYFGLKHSHNLHQDTTDSVNTKVVGNLSSVDCDEGTSPSTVTDVCKRSSPESTGERSSEAVPVPDKKPLYALFQPKKPGNQGVSTPEVEKGESINVVCCCTARTLIFSYIWN